MSAKHDGNRVQKRLGKFQEWAVTGIFVLGLFAFRSSLADQYSIPSGSMEPGIQIGDRVLVNKMAYDLRVPFTSFTLATLGQPKRGDIVVFESPRDPSIVMIKRLIGLPGDRIQVKDGRISVNGKPIELKTDWLEENCPQESEGEAGLKCLTVSEAFADTQTSHRIQRIPEFFRREEREWLVPANQYFFMGDNRDNSSDSRMWGFASRSALKGKALKIIFAWNFSRIGTAL